MNCNLATCRYNKNGKCTSEEDRKICVDVAKKVLCVGESEEDGKKQCNYIFNIYQAWNKSVQTNRENIKYY